MKRKSTKRKTKCPGCDGTGKMLIYDLFGHHYETCSICHGTGKILWK